MNWANPRNAESRSTLRAVAALVLITCFPRPAIPSTACVDYFDGFAWSAIVPTPPSVYDQVIEGDILYVVGTGASTESLSIVDVSNPLKPVTVFSQFVEGAQDIEVSGGQLLVQALDRNMLRFDVSDPAHAQQIDSIEFPSSIRQIAFDGETGYVVHGDSASGGTLSIVRAEAGAPMSIEANLPLVETPRDLTLQGRVLFVAWTVNAISAFDVSVPTKPLLLGRYDDVPNMRPGTLEVEGDRLFFEELNYGVYILDIADPRAMHLVGGVQVPGGNIVDIAVDSRRMLVSQYGLGLAAESLSLYEFVHPLGIRLLGKLRGEYRHLDLSGGFAFVNDVRAGIGIFGLRERFEMVDEFVSLFDTPGWPSDVIQVGNHAIIADYNRGILVASVAQPAVPTYVGSISWPPAWTSRLAWEAPYVYATFRGGPGPAIGVWIVSLEEMSSPVSMSLLPVAEEVVDIAVEGGIVWVAASEEGVLSIDATNVLEPKVVGAWSSGEEVRRIELLGKDRLAVLGSGPLRVLDISNPQVPEVLFENHDCSNGSAIAVKQGIACVLTWDGRFMTLDVEDPSGPRVLGETATYVGGTDVDFDNGFACSTHQYPSIAVTDVRIPLAPRVIAQTLELPSEESVNVQGSTILVTSQLGLFVLYPQCKPSSDNGFDGAARPVLNINLVDDPISGGHWSPNPFEQSTAYSTQLTGAGPFDLTIYDLTGRRVYKYTGTTAESGPGSLRWDGTDESGAPVAPGVYWSILESAGRSESSRLVRLR